MQKTNTYIVTNHTADQAFEIECLTIDDAVTAAETAVTEGWDEPDGGRMESEAFLFSVEIYECGSCGATEADQATDGCPCCDEWGDERDGVGVLEPDEPHCASLEDGHRWVDGDGEDEEDETADATCVHCGMERTTGFENAKYSGGCACEGPRGEYFAVSYKR